MDELRSWFEVPAIAHYFHVFRNAFDLIDFDIEDFEETLLVDGSDNVSSFIPDLLIRLLRGLYKTKDGLQVTMDNYGHYLHDLLNFHYGALQKKENPLINSKFKELRTRIKVEIIYDMINWRLDLEDAMELTKNLEADVMRVEPVGKDNDGNVYWYFYGSRLYKEGYSVKNDESQDESESDVKNIKTKKRKKKPVAQTRSGRPVRKKRKVDTSSDESGDESEKSVEIPDDDSATTSSSLKNDGKSLKLNISHNVWSVICYTVETWEGLIDSFRGATSKTEKQLFKNLEELYEGIPAILKSREEKVQKKLLAMAPRRVSDRITYKMQLREEEERQQEQERLMKKQLKAKEDEEKQKKLEIEKAVEREKRYKEREKIMEQRALRAKLREAQKIVRVHPDLANAFSSPSPGSNSSTSTSKIVMKKEIEEEEDNDFSSMSIVLEALKEHDDAWLFLEPVKEEEAPNYYTYIKNPMDFQTIGEKIKAKAYKDKFDFENDVLLVFDNCETYNGTYSPFTKLAFKVKKQFHKVMKREFPKDIHEDDDDFFQNDDQLTKPKKTAKAARNSSTLPSKNSIPNHITPQPTKKERKPKKEKVPSDLSSAGKLIQPRVKPIQNILQKAQVSQLSPISATNFLSTRFGIPPYVLKQMSPAQMQSLILRYPRAGFVPALQGLMGHKLNVSSTATATATATATMASLPNVVVGTTTLSPLHQLANTALAPSPAPSSQQTKSVSIALPVLPKSATLAAPNVNKQPQGVRVVNTGQGQSTLGRPRKNTLASASIVSTSTGGYVSGLSVSGVPITIQWDELKKQLMAQMVPAASSSTNSPPAGKYVSGVTVSGAPVTIEWEELKKQLVSQMKKEDSAHAPLSKENIAMSLLHLNSAANNVVGMAPASAISGMPNLRPNLVSMTSASNSSGIPNLRPNLCAPASVIPIMQSLRPNMVSRATGGTMSGIPNLRANVVTIATGSATSGIPNLRPNLVTVASNGALSGIPNVVPVSCSSSISGIPSLRPLNMPAGVSLRLSKDLTAATTTTPANSKMFSFSNVLKNKEFASASPSKPVTIKTPTFDSNTPSSVTADHLPTTSSLPLSGVKLQSGNSKVQDWLQSSSPFIVQSIENTRPVISGEMRAAVDGSATMGKSPALRFLSNQSSTPQISTTTNHSAPGKESVPMEYIPRPSFLTSSSSMKVVPIPLPNVHYVTTIASNAMNAMNAMNVIPMKATMGPQSRTFTSVAASKSNLLDLQKAALQAAAVNQISSKLHNHLKKDQQKEKNMDAAFNYVIKDSVISNKLKKTNEVVTVYKPPNDTLPLATGSGVVKSYLSSSIASTVVLNQFNNFSSTQLINPSAGYLNSSSSATSVVPQSRVLIMPNRSTPDVPGAASFSSTQLNTQPTRPVAVVPQPNIQSVRTALPQVSIQPARPVSANPHATIQSARPAPAATQVAFQPSQTVPQISIQPGHPVSSVQQVNFQPVRCCVAASQIITSRFSPMMISTATSKMTLMNPHTPTSCNSLPFVKAPIPIQIPQSHATQLITTLPSTKYVTFAPKPVAMQPSHLSKLIVPSVPALSKISQAQTPGGGGGGGVRFQTISSDVPVIQPKPNIASKQFVVQQQRLREQGQGQTVRYILPAQTQLPGGQIINLNQLGSVQNLFINNVPIAKNPTTKSVRIVSGNLSNGVAKSTPNKVLVSPNMGITRLPSGSPVINTGISTQTIVMRSPIKAVMSSVTSPMTSLSSSNSVLTAASNMTPKKIDNPENIVISRTFVSKVESNSKVNNPAAAVLPRQPVHLQSVIPHKIELNAVNNSTGHPRQTILLQQPSSSASSAKLELNANNNSASAFPRHTIQLPPASPDARKLLPKTAMPFLPNGVSAQSVPASSLGGSAVKSPDGKTAAEKQKHIVLDPAQLQKLKEEGRIVMTPTGQLIMIPPNLVGKVPGSVFK